jgi:DnaJ-class molecular chaperone
MKWHPDKHEGDAKEKAEKNFMRIAKAYETLSDPEKVSLTV